MNIGLLLIAYLIGMMPNEKLLGFLMNKDNLEAVRSDAIGAVKMLQNIKQPAFFMMLLLDVLKGASLVLMAIYLGTWHFLPMLLLLIALIGHNFNPITGIRNGLGIAILSGGLLIYTPVVFVLYLILTIILQLFINDLDTASALGTIVIPISSALILQEVHSIIIGIAIIMVVFIQKTVYIQYAAFRTDYGDYKTNNPFYKK